MTKEAPYFLVRHGPTATAELERHVAESDLMSFLRPCHEAPQDEGVSSAGRVVGANAFCLSTTADLAIFKHISLYNHRHVPPKRRRYVQHRPAKGTKSLTSLSIRRNGIESPGTPQSQPEKIRDTPVHSLGSAVF